MLWYGFNLHLKCLKCSPVACASLFCMLSTVEMSLSDRKQREKVQLCLEDGGGYL